MKGPKESLPIIIEHWHHQLFWLRIINMIFIRTGLMLSSPNKTYIQKRDMRHLKNIFLKRRLKSTRTAYFISEMFLLTFSEYWGIFKIFFRISLAWISVLRVIYSVFFTFYFLFFTSCLFSFTTVSLTITFLFMYVSYLFWSSSTFISGERK